MAEKLTLKSTNARVDEVNARLEDLQAEFDARLSQLVSDFNTVIHTVVENQSTVADVSHSEPAPAPAGEPSKPPVTQTGPVCSLCSDWEQDDEGKWRKVQRRHADSAAVRQCNLAS